MVDPLQDGQASLEEELPQLERGLQQLKLEYDRYFLDQRPREPSALRADLKRKLLRGRSRPIRNTAIRFRLDALCDRFQAFERQWDKARREIEVGLYTRHVFKARLRARPHLPRPEASATTSSLFEAYRTAASSCGHCVDGLTPQRFQQAVDRQTEALQKKYGRQPLDFEVVVSNGRVRLRARPLQN